MHHNLHDEIHCPELEDRYYKDTLEGRFTPRKSDIEVLFGVFVGFLLGILVMMFFGNSLISSVIN